MRIWLVAGTTPSADAATPPMEGNCGDAASASRAGSFGGLRTGAIARKAASVACANAMSVCTGEWGAVVSGVGHRPLDFAQDDSVGLRSGDAASRWRPTPPQGDPAACIAKVASLAAYDAAFTSKMLMEFDRATAGDPPAMKWFRVYAGVMAGLYLLCVALGVVGLAFAEQLADAEMTEAHVGLMSVIIGGMGLVFAIAFLLPFFVPRRRWVWIYDLVLIGIGLSSCLTIVPCIFLLIAWLKPEVQSKFGPAA